ncbi:MAG: ABC transporter substrate-binding protein [Deltaproteobacteria bacterium]|nr:ABC transporter substrate-binding protein [Deltaproteobacteria bacterium]MBW2418203.1 ABC transporter substrate-binding protein [Deltaproteobacteria bacterium]
MAGLISSGVLIAALGGSLRPALISGRALQPTRVEGLSFPKQLIDPSGASHSIESAPRRIVSTTLAADETLGALIDPARVVGVTYLADDARQSSVADLFPDDIARVGVEIESLLALEPDLVFVASFTRVETVRLLLATGIPVVRFAELGSFDGVAQNLRLAGAVLGEEDRAEVLIQEMFTRIAAVERRVAGRTRPRVLAWGDSGYSKARGTLMDEIIERAGGYNVMRDTGLRGATKIGAEFAIGLEPDVILMEGDAGDPERDVAARLLANPTWSQVPAVSGGRVYAHRGAWVSSVTHYRVRDLEEVARMLHPGAGL